MFVSGKARVAWVGVLLALACVVMCGMAAVAEMVIVGYIVTGAGDSSADGEYLLAGDMHGSAYYENANGWVMAYADHPETPRWFIGVEETGYYYREDESAEGEWVAEVYATPPAPTVTAVWAEVAAPEPTMTIVPAGDGGEGQILDLPLPEDANGDPVMLGALRLSGEFPGGDTITGGLRILDGAGNPIRASYVGVFVYSVDITSVPEARTLLTHWRVVFDFATESYDFEWDTEDVLPGVYDIYFTFEDGSTQIRRVRLI